MQCGARRGDGLLDPSHLVTAEIDQNDDVPGPQSRAQKLADIGKKQLAIHWTVGDQRRGPLLVPQAGYKRGGIPMAVRGRSDAALPFGCTSVEPPHAGRCPSFIYKHQLFDVHPSLCFTPRAPRRLHVGAFSLVGVQGFF